MLIVRTPVRISLAGGGTDVPAYYNEYGGTVVSTTINKYFYVFLTILSGEGLQVTSSDYRTFYRYDGQDSLLWDDDLGLPRAILDHFGVTQGLSMFLASEIPPGTGLGSSSTVTVAIIKALTAAQGLSLTRQELAELACTIELEKLNQPIGKQDQYAAAFGGFNTITFSSEGVEVEPLRLSLETLERLQERLLLFFTGSSRSASETLGEQTRASRDREPSVIRALHAVRDMAQEVRDCLKQGQLDRFGELMDRNWQQKKQYAPGITTPLVDRCYAVAKANGAIGGKLTGAGGGGFLMICSRAGSCDQVTQALEAEGLQRMDYRFENSGAQVLMNASPRLPVNRDWRPSNWLERAPDV